MLDPRSLQERRAEILESCRKRRVAVDLEGAIACQEHLASLQTELNDAGRRRNEHQEAGKRKLSPEEREAHTVEGRRLKDEVARLEHEVEAARRALETALAGIPNFMHPDVPDGGEDDSRELRRVGDAAALRLQAEGPRRVAEALDLVDFEARREGRRAEVLLPEERGACCSSWRCSYALDVLVEDGFTPIITPDLARLEILEGIGFSPRGPETQVYTHREHRPVPRSARPRSPSAACTRTRSSTRTQLPLKYVGLSHCFRTEAGPPGRESKGLYRVHQFTKVEMFAFTHPEDSDAMHAELLAIEEEIFQGAGAAVPRDRHRTGDLGGPAYRKFDLEAWMPGRGEGGEYGEVTSTSNCTDYQARRLRHPLPAQGRQGDRLVHTLNGTAVASTRAIVAILENYQQADGTVAVPEALRPTWAATSPTSALTSRRSAGQGMVTTGNSLLEKPSTFWTWTTWVPVAGTGARVTSTSPASASKLALQAAQSRPSTRTRAPARSPRRRP